MLNIEHKKKNPFTFKIINIFSVYSYMKMRDSLIILSCLLVNLGARYNVYSDLYGLFSSQGQACTKLYIPKIYDRFEILYEPVIVYRRIWIDV